MVYANLDSGKTNSMRYVGQWKNGEPNGEGVLYSGTARSQDGGKESPFFYKEGSGNKVLAKGLFANKNFMTGYVNTENYQGEFSNSLQNG